MPSVARHKLIAAVATAPSIGASQATKPYPKRARASAPDPVVARVRNWIAAKDRQDRLVRQWQDLEDQLCGKTRPLGMKLTQALGSSLPEAQEMRSLMRQIRAMDRKLYQETKRLVQLQAKSPEGALAKIEMGLRSREPLDCEEPVWGLLRSGFKELSRILRDRDTGDSG